VRAITLEIPDILSFSHQHWYQEHMFVMAGDPQHRRKPIVASDAH
jgi:hypothetical protein